MTFPDFLKLPDLHWT